MDSEGQKIPQGQPPEPQRQASAAGATLAAQREAMGLSVEQIADQLKLAPRQVVAIEQGDYASLPNMAVTRGFIRAYAKVLRLDPAPLVAQIEVTPSVTATDHAPIRREKIPTKFSESRFPTLTERQSKPKVWLAGGVVALVVIAGAAAWQAGLVSPGALRKPGSEVPAAATTPAAPGTAATTATTTAPLMSPNVPLVSTPGPATPDNTAPLVTTPGQAAAPAAGTPATAPATAATTPATAATTPATAATTPAPATPAAVTPAAAAPAPAAATPAAAPAVPGANTLTLVFTADSWVEIRRPGASPLISRLVKAGSTETFEIDRQSTLIVGAPDGVRATLRGQPLALPKVANGSISRVQVK